MGDILRLKEFVYDVWTVRMGVVIPKHKFGTHGTLKQTDMFSQKDVTIDLTCHGSNLNKQVSSGIRKISPIPNEQSCTIETVSFNDVLLVVTGTRRSLYGSLVRIRLQAKPGLVGKQHTSPLLWCPQCMLSTPG
ncbi:uncharacterized protein TNCV_4991161 [Trichonephila clavipes]|nr:uncharacterized protein TNCV_4991161 [Trichonephila clavipes]